MNSSLILLKNLFDSEQFFLDIYNFFFSKQLIFANEIIFLKQKNIFFFYL